MFVKYLQWDEWKFIFKNMRNAMRDCLIKYLHQNVNIISKDYSIVNISCI